jgi:Carboxypeptidase regulatory-like domain
VIRSHRISPVKLLASVALLLAVLAPLPARFSLLPVAQAQYLGQRNITGRVFDDSGKPVAEATVFLKNLKTRSLRSFSSTADGTYQFVQVGMSDDYELWAEKGDRKGPVRTVSSFDSRKQLNLDLKLK